MRKRALLAPFVVFAFALTATVASADAPVSGDGDLFYGPAELLDMTTVGQTTFIDVGIDGTISGPLNGTIEEQYTVVHHARAGFNTYRGVLDFEGVVFDTEGVEHFGTLTLLTQGRQDPGMPFPTDTPWIMRWVIVEGGGELEQVQGHGTGILTLEEIGFVLDYEGQVHFSGH